MCSDNLGPTVAILVDLTEAGPTNWKLKGSEVSVGTVAQEGAPCLSGS